MNVKCTIHRAVKCNSELHSELHSVIVKLIVQYNALATIAPRNAIVANRTVRIANRLPI